MKTRNCVNTPESQPKVKDEDENEESILTTSTRVCR